MVKEIRIYIEGGGDGKNTKSLFKKGFSGFFKDIVEVARQKRIKWNIVICGSRNNTFRDFQNALEDHPNAFNILLVDSEAPYKKTSPWKHLQSGDGWNIPSLDNEHCYLMIQAMEAWLIADIRALKTFYGKRFNENSIPKNSNVETIDKNSLEPSLKAATRNTSKGEYQKIKHASKLLEQLDIDKVRKSAPECDRLFTTLNELISDRLGE